MCVGVAGGVGGGGGFVCVWVGGHVWCWWLVVTVVM